MLVTVVCLISQHCTAVQQTVTGLLRWRWRKGKKEQHGNVCDVSSEHLQQMRNCLNWIFPTVLRTCPKTKGKYVIQCQFENMILFSLYFLLLTILLKNIDLQFSQW